MRAVEVTSLTYGGFLVDGLDDKLLVVEGDVSDLAPRESDFGRHSVEGEMRKKTKRVSRLVKRC